MIFLDHAAGSHPKPPEVYAEAVQALRQPHVSDRGANPVAEAGTELLDSTRQEAAALFGVADPQRVAFTLNGTDAINMALHGLLEPGDHVVTSDQEHNSVARPLTYLQMRGKLALTRVETDNEGRVDPAALERAIVHRTRLVVLAHGCSALGTVQPLEEIARVVRAKGAQLLIDASHTAGVVAIDMDRWGIDCLATSGHTGLLGPAGTGLLLLGEGVCVRPLRMGESGPRAVLRTHPLELPDALEAGTPNLPGIAGLRAGLRFVRATTVARIRDHETLLIKRFIGAIGLDERFKLFAARGDLPRTGAVSFRLGGFTPEQVVTLLHRRFGVVMAAGLHGAPGAHARLGTLPQGTVRASVGWFTREEEIDRAVSVLREIAEEGIEQALRALPAPPLSPSMGTPQGEVAGAT